MAGEVAPVKPQTRGVRATSRPADLDAAIKAARALGTAPSGREPMLSDALGALAGRLAAARFQLSVVGQFKRGKSSLVNALLGADVLPAGVLPLTSAPTFIEAGSSFELMVSFQSADPQSWTPSSAEALQALLRAYVAEDANPRNMKGVEKVTLRLPSPFLGEGLVVIDTPGIGSTLRHNTDAAEAALPECDAALVVVSPDPPITQAELDYLERVRANAADLVVALNKTDTLEPEDLASAVTFLRGVLDDAGLNTAEIFPVSARAARRADQADDREAAEASGVPALRHRLGAAASGDRNQLLVTAIAQKAVPLVSELTFENDVALAALTTPVAVLDERLAAFRAAAIGFDRERLAAADQLQGDKRRLLDQLDAEAQTLREHFGRALQGDVDRKTAAGAEPRIAWDAVRPSVPDLFERELAKVVAEQKLGLAEVLSVHQARADALLAEVRQAAADLLAVPFRAPPSERAFEARDRPYWLERPRETLSSAPLELIDRLLPGALGRRRAARRVADEIGQVVTANVEHLRWSTRRNLDESLRRFGAALDTALAEGIAAVTTAVDQARTLRVSSAEGSRAALEIRQRRGKSLIEIQQILADILATEGTES